ncbi:recombinase family protein, partial [Brucella rhizosphaerae]|uniref:recombinase family protein n=1 Tax=Brucella rhizosphaerae TaxID=571254 RepID=UPI0035BC8186
MSWSRMVEILRHELRQEGGVDGQSEFSAGRVFIGYARVSTRGQDLDQQRAALSVAGCVRVFEEKISGAQRDRPELARMLDHLRV